VDRVIVLADRGLYARWLFRRLTRLGWHPFLRRNPRGTFWPTGQVRGVPLQTLVPEPGTTWQGTGIALKGRHRQLHCTLLACWEAGDKDPWLMVTDLPPETSTACWDGLRAWIAQGCKIPKRADWQWQRTHITTPDRAARLWLAVAVATLWLLSVGGEADATIPASTVLDVTALVPQLPRTRRATRLRLVRVCRRGWNLMLVALLDQAPLPMGRFVPEPWPAVPVPEEESPPLPTLALPHAAWVVFQKWRWTAMAVTLGLVFVASMRKEWPMTFIAVRCPSCQSDPIVKRGKTARGTQRSVCQNTLCARGSLLLDSGNRGCGPAVKQTIIDMRLNASGVRDTARSLPLCPTTVLRALKKTAPALASVHTAWLHTLHLDEVAWDMERAGEAAMEEMGSFVGHTGNPRWLWHAIDHHTGKVWASVFGRRQDTGVLQRKALLEPCGITRYYTDYWGAHTRHLDAAVPSPGKHNTQKIARTPLTLRTRIKRVVRKTICFSQTTQMHDIVIGLFVNRDAFGRAV